MYKKILAVSLVSLVLAGTSCKDTLDVQPKQSLDAAAALTDFTSVNALSISLYSRSQNFNYYGQRMLIAPDVLADNYTITANSGGRYVGERINTPNAHLDLWGILYPAINEANFIIGNVDRVTAAQADKDALKGQALFMRGLFNHDMMRIYAYEPGLLVNSFGEGIVLRTDPTDDVSKADFKPRASIADVYTQIENDLKQAATLLPVTVSGGSVFKASKGAAYALLARVYLYQRKWAEAEQAATDAITNKQSSTTLATAANYISSFATVPNRESMFELDYRPEQFTTVDGINNSMNSLTQKTSGGVFAVRATTELLNSFEPGDVRRTAFDQTLDNGVLVSYSLKFPAHKGNYFNNIPVIRLSEVYLIRAEARAQQNKTALAQADLTTLRTNRGLAAVPATTVGSDLLNLIFNERRVELNLEGHRFFDFKRRGLNISKPAGVPTLLYTDFRVLAPLPQAQVLLNTQIKQNPGY
jgi:hypothetical protein